MHAHACALCEMDVITAKAGPSPSAFVPSVRVGPGLTALTRTTLGPYSADSLAASRAPGAGRPDQEK